MSSVAGSRAASAFHREARSGPGVVCLHSNASTSGQWTALMERLAPRFNVFAADSYGAGKSPEWPSDRVIALRDEVALVEPVLSRAGTPLALVAHSYGAAIALVAAIDRPERMRALALYEPTLFAWLDAESPPPNGGDGIRAAVARAAAALDAGDRSGAAAHFIDCWMGAGTWRRIPEKRQAPIAASVANVRRWGHALFSEPTPLAASRALRMPTLSMIGGRSTASARGVAALRDAAAGRSRRVPGVRPHGADHAPRRGERDDRAVPRACLMAGGAVAESDDRQQCGLRYASAARPAHRQSNPTGSDTP